MNTLIAPESTIQRLEKRLEREKSARKQAEQLLESKSLELYRTNQELRALTHSLEATIATRTQELIEARDQALAASRAKSAFLAAMSHEIRTPMNGILGMASLLQDSSLNAHQQQQLHAILQSAQSLLGIINDILDISRLDADKLELLNTDFALADVLPSLLESLGVIAAQKQLELFCIVDRNVPALLHGDVLRFRQILMNLLGNAIKFTQQGQVVVRIQCTQTQPPALAVQVEDTGIGIPAEKHATLFHAFSQINPDDQYNHSGTGLGLAICRKLVTLMGGTIGVRSEQGQGTTFWFEVPFVVDATPHPLPTHRTCCLLVAQPARYAGLIAEQLHQLGVKTHVAPTVFHARQLLHQHRIDWFTIDESSLPLNEHYLLHPLLQTLQADYSHIKILKIVPQHHLTTECRLPHSKNNHHEINKPLTQLKFFKLLTHSPMPLNLQGMPAQSSAVAPAMTDRHEIHILVVEDHKINQMVAKGMLNKLGYLPTIANDGQEAIKLLQQREFALILMDIQMPGMNGVETTLHIRQTLCHLHTPIIALTANAMKGDEERYLAAGMDACLTKPISFVDLQNTLQHWLPRQVSNAT